MPCDDLTGLRITVDNGVATLTLDHPPLNLMDGVLLPSLRGFVNRVRYDTGVRVVVFDRADPEFFSAHGDMAYLTDPEALPAVTAAATAAAIAAAPDVPVPDGMNILEAVSDEVRSLPQVTIGKIAGFARGAGNEFLMYLDMRFAAIGRSGQAQPEAVMDILPGGGGTVNMARLLGRARARALELLLGSELVDAELAERYGLVNRAVPANEIDAFVDRLARRIARLRPEVVAAIKATVETITPKIPHQAYAVENAALFSLFTDDMVASAHKQLAAGVQTREGERDLERILDTL
ncbi:enoyl-CoA hydratase/isomerase family protein [Streptomyces sp. NPDC088348]|uniref:enoyl-CoA hydratase/isomerase family protein n=1 Tax=Streptomyces sp. NPDC088348 TaxID=3365853 RepID=UPI00382AA330